MEQEGSFRKIYSKSFKHKKSRQKIYRLSASFTKSKWPEPNNFDRVVSPIWTRRPDILKIENLWKTQIQKFKTPKQAIKFV